MKSYTPGPWSVVKDNPYPGVRPVAPIVRGSTLSEAKANAHLISTAPELYDCLDDLLVKIQGPLSEIIPAIQRAISVLKKARGEP